MRFCNKFLGLFSSIQGRRRWSKEEIDCALESLKSSGVIEKCFTLPVLFWYWLVSKLFYNLDQVFSKTAGFFSSNFLCFLVRSYNNFNKYTISLFLIPRVLLFSPFPVISIKIFVVVTSTNSPVVILRFLKLTADFSATEYNCISVSNFLSLVRFRYYISRPGMAWSTCSYLVDFWISGAGKGQVQVHIYVYFYQIQKANLFS